MRQRSCASSCTQRTPAGLPRGRPGIGVVIDGAMQHAPQALRHSMVLLSVRGRATAFVEPLAHAVA